MHLPVNTCLSTTSSLRTIAHIYSVPAIRYLSSGVSQTTSASSSKNPYPFPSHRNPTPHQIFHLDTTASDAQIKSRYYELVKLFHPDTAYQDGKPSKARQERFQRITAAYNHLRRNNRRSRLPSVSSTYRNSTSQYPANGTWNAKRNEWTGFEYQFDEQFNVKGDPAGNAGTTSGAKPTYEKTFNKSDSPYWIFFAVAFVAGVSQVVFFSPGQEAARHNRRANKSLNDARLNREENGAKRREELKLWAEQQRRQKEDSKLSDGDEGVAPAEEEPLDAATSASSGVLPRAPSIIG
ncbi:hypothetical protein FRB97_007751 [Tulasnella sp. 331]|nr:hypothetical protein FRB97_007751 [Tulasnella sp. 331]